MATRAHRARVAEASHRGRAAISQPVMVSHAGQLRNLQSKLLLKGEVPEAQQVLVAVMIGNHQAQKHMNLGLGF